MASKALAANDFSYLRFAIGRVGGMPRAAGIVKVSLARFHEMCKRSPREWKGPQIDRLAEAAGISRDDLMSSESLSPEQMEDETPKPKRGKRP